MSTHLREAWGALVKQAEGPPPGHVRLWRAESGGNLNNYRHFTNDKSWAEEYGRGEWGGPSDRPMTYIDVPIDVARHWAFSGDHWYAIDDAIGHRLDVALPEEFWGMAKTAMPSWRAQGVNFWDQFDAVIATDANGRGRNFEVFTHGTNWATRHSIAEAKASVEEVYGPLTWRRVRLPVMPYDHPYFGEIGDEMTDPHSILVADLPKLGGPPRNP